jgi:hypothetical protein
VSMEMDMSHKVVLIFDIDADNSKAAEGKVREWMNEKISTPEEWPEDMDAVVMCTSDSFGLDNTNQRVLYLPVEEDDENT